MCVVWNIDFHESLMQKQSLCHIFQIIIFCKVAGIGCCSSYVLSVFEVVVLLSEMDIYQIAGEIIGPSSAV